MMMIVATIQVSVTVYAAFLSNILLSTERHDRTWKPFSGHIAQPYYRCSEVGTWSVYDYETWMRPASSSAGSRLLLLTAWFWACQRPSPAHYPGGRQRAVDAASCCLNKYISLCVLFIPLLRAAEHCVAACAEFWSRLQESSSTGNR